MQVKKSKVSQKTAISRWPVTPEAAGTSPVTPATFPTFSLFRPFYILAAPGMRW